MNNERQPVGQTGSLQYNHQTSNSKKKNLAIYREESRVWEGAKQSKYNASLSTTTQQSTLKINNDKERTPRN